MNVKDQCNLAKPKNSDAALYLYQMTSKPLIEAIFDDCRATSWLLAVTGMVWGSDEMWQTLGDTTIRVDRQDYLGRIFRHSSVKSPAPPVKSQPTGDIEMKNEAAYPISTASTSSDSFATDTRTLLACSFTFPFYLKKYLCRTWYLLVRIMILISVILILQEVEQTSSTENNSSDEGYLLLPCTIFIQLIATIVTTQFMIQRMNTPAPAYCLPHFRGYTVCICAFFFVLTISPSFVATFSPIFIVVVLFSNYTLLACLMLILVDIQSSIALVDSLMVLIPSNDMDIASLIEAEDIEETPSPLVAVDCKDPILHESDSLKAATTRNPFTLKQYEIVRQEVKKRVQESWYTNTFAVIVAVLNLATLIVGAFTFFPRLDEMHIASLVLQFSKEIVFLFIVFCYCAELNAKVVRFNDQLGSYLAWHQKPMHIWQYACLNPISFELGGYAVTWKGILLQLLSVAVGVGFGLVRQEAFSL